LLTEAGEDTEEGGETADSDDGKEAAPKDEESSTTETGKKTPKSTEPEADAKGYYFTYELKV